MKKLTIYLFLATVFIFSNCFALEVQSNLQLQKSDGEAFSNHYVKHNLYSFNEFIYSKQTSFGSSFNIAKINSINNGERYALFSPELFHRYKFLAPINLV